MQLVQHQEAQPLGVGDQRFLLLGPGQDQLQHDIVGQQDVRRIGHDAVLFFIAFLAGIALEGDQRFIVWEAQLEELAQLAHLAVGQGVHGVDDDRLDAFARIAQHIIHDWDDVGQRFARPGAGGQHIVMPCASDADGLFLVFVQAQRAAGWVLFVFAAEDSFASLIQQAFVGQFVNSNGLARTPG